MVPTLVLLVAAATPPPAVTFALCRAKAPARFPPGARARVEAVAQYTTTGALEPLDEARVGRMETPAPLVAQLASTRWYLLTPRGETGQATFKGGRLVRLWNEADEEGLPLRGNEQGKLVLGACDAPGTLYATVPLSVPAARDGTKKDAAAGVNALLALRDKPVSGRPFESPHFPAGSPGAATSVHFGPVEVTSVQFTARIPRRVPPGSGGPPPGADEPLESWRYQAVRVSHARSAPLVLWDVGALHWARADGIGLVGLGVLDGSVRDNSEGAWEIGFLIAPGPEGRLQLTELALTVEGC